MVTGLTRELFAWMSIISSSGIDHQIMVPTNFDVLNNGLTSDEMFTNAFEHTFPSLKLWKPCTTVEIMVYTHGHCRPQVEVQILEQQFLKQNEKSVEG